MQGRQTLLQFTGDTLEVATPIMVGAEVLGGAQFGFDTGPLDSEIREIIFQHIWQSLVLMVIGVALSYLLARHFTRPLRRLVVATKKVAEGEFGFSAGAQRNDEIGGLAVAFENMSRRLGRSTAELTTANQQLLQSKEDLETTVVERTADLSTANEELRLQVLERQQAEEALARQAEELVRSNTDLEQFAYVASHDLQEPLRAMTRFSQLLARRYQGKLGADADEFISYIVDGGTRMQELIDDLLVYSRVTTRARDLEPTECEVVLDHSLANLQVAVEGSRALVSHDPLPMVRADPSQLVQVFQNLLSNALKYCGDKPPEIHVSAERKDGEWLFSVRDNGIGIEPQYAERVFGILQRLHTREEYPGTGIGLAICKRIVERHQGGIGWSRRSEMAPPFTSLSRRKGDNRL